MKVFCVIYTFVLLVRLSYKGSHIECRW